MFPILLFPPKIPYDFVKFTCFLHTLCVFRFPTYFDHDAFMHHTMHVLDAHAQIRWNPKSKLPKWLLVVSLMSSSVYPIGAKLRGSQTFSTTWCRRDTMWAGCYMYTTIKFTSVHECSEDRRYMDVCEIPLIPLYISQWAKIGSYLNQ